MAVEVAVQKTQNLKTIPPSDQFGFGKYFSDHMFLCEYSTEKGWQNPRITPYGPLPLDPGASVLHYGQALFEGMKAFRGEDGKIRIFRPEMNWKRLCNGAERLAMQAPPQDIFMAAIENFVRLEERWVPHAKGTAFYLRPTLIGTEGFLGVRPSSNYLFYVIGSPAGGYFGEGIEAVKIWVEKKYSRSAPGGIGAVKAGGNYASSLLAAVEAKKKGYSQVLWLDSSQHRFVEEVGTMNVFFVIDGKVVTPALNGTILPGVMRDSAIKALKDKGLKVEERAVPLDEIVIAHERGLLTEVFGTGTAASVSPVGQLGFEERTLLINDGRPGPVARDLYATLIDIQYGRSSDENHWTLEL